MVTNTEFLMWAIGVVLSLLAIGMSTEIYLKRRTAKMLNACSKGEHKLTPWVFNEESYNDRDIYVRNCKRCGCVFWCISRLHPDAPRVIQYRKKRKQ